MQKITITLLTGMLTFLLAACSSDNETNTAGSNMISADNVFVMPIRRIKDGFSVEEFESTRDAYVALLEAQQGTITDREVQPFFDFAFSSNNLDRIYTGITSFVDFSTFQEIGETVSGDVANEFFNTFDFISFQVLQPINTNQVVDLASLAPLGSNQVWEIAVRDVSQYDTFDQSDYEARRDAYLSILSDQVGFVEEIQWQSISDPNVVVGMTIYENTEAVQSINSNVDFINAYTATGFLDSYPPNVFGMISTVLK